MVNVTLELAVHKPFVTVQTAVAVVPGATPVIVVDVEVELVTVPPPVTVQVPDPTEGVLPVTVNVLVLQSV